MSDFSNFVFLNDLDTYKRICKITLHFIMKERIILFAIYRMYSLIFLSFKENINMLVTVCRKGCYTFFIHCLAFQMINIRSEELSMYGSD